MRTIIIKGQTFTIRNGLHCYVAVDRDGEVNSFHSEPNAVTKAGMWIAFGGETIGKLPERVDDWTGQIYSLAFVKWEKLSKFNVYGVSDWAESDGEKFEIFIGKEFANAEAAAAAAKAVYSDLHHIIVEPVK